jgi:hypothetical protein
MRNRTTPDSVSKDIEDLIAELNEIGAEGTTMFSHFSGPELAKWERLYTLCELYIETVDRIKYEDIF